LATHLPANAALQDFNLLWSRISTELGIVRQRWTPTWSPQLGRYHK